MIEVICIKKCVSSKFHIAEYGKVYERTDDTKGSVEDTKNRMSNISIDLFQKLFYKYPNMFHKHYDRNENPFYPEFEIFEIDDSGKRLPLGKFDARNFVTPAEFRCRRINDIFED